ncbi:serine O-acetyltransferase [uncultured Porticoccus sp.]|uniref:serine O-acetyltransferase n=1 Tax=uncultured Porticoccus sp. TaxID=1256050 RepID=UPI002622D7A5|nr:serine O-acetyltransferase [uncultured Porticoccus sp.]
MVDLPQTTSADDALWQSIRHEIVERARLEPVLASFFHAAVLSHKSLEDALAYNLAEQLGNSILSPLAIHQVLLDAMQSDSSICERMRRDLRAHMERDPACGQYCLPLLYFKGFHALQVYRVANWLWRHQRRSLALFLQSRASEIFAVDIHPAAEIAGGIMLDHATGLVIGETAVIGENVSLLHSVTLGGTGAQAGDRHPKIRCGVLIAAGAKVLGNIEVGEGAKIGAGSLVLDSVLPHTTVVGVPARVVGVPGEAEPSRTMDQRINLGCG